MTESTGAAAEPGSQAQFDFPAGTVLRVRARKALRLGRRVAIRQGDVTTGTVDRRDQYAVTLSCEATVPGMSYKVSAVRWDLELLEVVSAAGPENTKFVRYHPAKHMAGLHELSGVTESAAVVLRKDGSVDVYGYGLVAVVDQRPAEEAAPRAFILAAAEGEPASWICEDCGWPWPLAGKPPAGSECDSCGGELVPAAR